MTKPPGTFWVVRTPDSQGDIVARVESTTEYDIPPEVADYEDFIIQQVSDRSTLSDMSVNQSKLTESERERIEAIYPA